MDHLGTKITFERLGDAGIVWRSALALALHAFLTRASLLGVTCSVPAEDVLTILYDAALVDAADLENRLRAIIPTLRPPEREPARTLTIPVSYDGPDLHDVARLTDLSPSEVIALHSGTFYEVAFLGFLPGFAYLRGLPSVLQLPRRATPRTRLEPGSVGIGGPWTAVYPLASPGGWHLLGRTSKAMFDASRDEPIVLRPGDLVRFEAV
ncbi:5-oxoprolinase subunit PxpB [Deinococcus yavapaiensis]|uniref:KipI family sensor histidine kinase inhibitor n=1 Tax=Deinococcus yavapaiensis KR-236 TaxID=694435 RepID=A0A318S8H8_9DEIO|nr:5-oxoprolinase subunit PxpB [Deinococcus yavapaiensis]PYE51932.1 KipI family sensor histidine kinase inhibitor [Deinococcus yavapaiensis KR-236]